MGMKNINEENDTWKTIYALINYWVRDVCICAEKWFKMGNGICKGHMSHSDPYPPLIRTG